MVSFNWKAIESYEDAEVALYRLFGEMLRRRATADDLERVRSFLLESELPPDGWSGLGEALHHTTNGSPAGYDIWHEWLGTFEDVDLEEDRLGAKWVEFGEELSEPVEDTDFNPDVDLLPGAAHTRATATLHDESAVPPLISGDAPPTVEVAIEASEFDDDSTNMMAPSGLHAPVTGVLAESATQLLRMVPAGLFHLRLFELEYSKVDEYTVLTLIKRGLFLGVEVRFGDSWIPAWQHPAFEAISRRMRNEAGKILTRNFDADSLPTGSLS